MRFRAPKTPVERLRSAATAFRYYADNPEETSISASICFCGGMKPQGLGKGERDEILNAALNPRDAAGLRTPRWRSALGVTKQDG